MRHTLYITLIEKSMVIGVSTSTARHFECEADSAIALPLPIPAAKYRGWFGELHVFQRPILAHHRF